MEIRFKSRSIERVSAGRTVGSKWWPAVWRLFICNVYSLSAVPGHSWWINNYKNIFIIIHHYSSRFGVFIFYSIINHPVYSVVRKTGILRPTRHNQRSKQFGTVIWWKSVYSTRFTYLPTLTQAFQIYLISLLRCGQYLISLLILY